MCGNLSCKIISPCGDILGSFLDYLHGFVSISLSLLFGFVSSDYVCVTQLRNCTGFRNVPKAVRENVGYSVSFLCVLSKYNYAEKMYNVILE